VDEGDSGVKNAREHPEACRADGPAPGDAADLRDVDLALERHNDRVL
jgi:hypothetical protein